MSIIIIFPENPDGSEFVIPATDIEHFKTTVMRATVWNIMGRTVTVHMQLRRPDGWLEHYIEVTNPDGSRVIFIGAIQRTIDGTSEFHS
ncbi:hypothetical protein D3C76_28230 [compost metagenome]